MSQKSMITVKPHIINEPSLVHGNWIKITIPADSSEPDTIAAITTHYQDALNQAKLLGLHKIEVEFNPHWQLLPNSLRTLKFSPSLIESVYPCTTSNDITNYITQNYSNLTVPFRQVLPLLSQQADYHHSLFPHYYQSSTDINWRHYQKEWQHNFANPNTIFITYSPRSKVSGLILGGVENNDGFFIWELVVDHKLRGQGIGTNLIKLLLHQVHQDPFIDQVFVETGHNQPAAHLYHRFGFTPTHQTWYKNL